MAILPKGGVNIAGHKIPWEAIAALAGVAGVILIIRARQQGANVAAVGHPPAGPYDAAMSGFGSTGFAPDYSAALANISGQLTSLQQGALSVTPSPAPVAPGPALAIPLGRIPGVGIPGFVEGDMQPHLMVGPTFGRI